MVNPPPPDTDPPQQQKLFAKGSPVEVSSDEEGFRGAWYSATILESPPKSTFKKRKKAFVQYKTLLAEDGSSPLTEYIEPVFIRPLPPKEKEEEAQSAFGLNDVVDARYRDGWWTGVVRKVLDKFKYRVYFDNPPDIIEIERKDLRPHWDWIDGKWVRPQKQQSTGSTFSIGTAVEVNIDIENVRDVWLPAIVIKENENNSFLVKYQSSRTDDESGTEKAVVDSHHIRPTPPRYVDRNYELLERVDTIYNFGWRSGVITKVLTGRRYKVFFKNEKEDKELSHSDIRPNVEWIDGKWVSKSKEVLIASDDQEQIENAQHVTQNPELAGELESSFSTKDNSEDKSPTNKSKNFVEQPTPTDEDNALLSSKKKIKLETSNGNTLRLRPPRKVTEENTVETPLSVKGDHLKDMPNETSCKEGTLRTGGTGTRVMKKSVIDDQPCAKSEGPLTGTPTQTASNDCVFCQHHRSNWKTKRQKVGSVESKANNLVKRNVRARKSPSEGSQTAGKEGVACTAEEIDEGEIKTKEVELPIIIGLSAKSTKTLQAENSSKIPNEEPKPTEDQGNDVNDSLENENMEIKELKVGVSNQRRRGRPRKAVVTSPRAFNTGKELNWAGGLADEKRLKDCINNEAELSKLKGVEPAASQDALRGRTHDVSVTDHNTKESNAGISDMEDEDQPLSTWIGGIHSSGDEESRLSSGRLVNGWNEDREGLIDVPVESLAMDARGRSPLDDDRSLPFVKKSPVWRTIESMDVFQIVPQKPHFQPLAENKEEFREGSAIGIMVTFAGLFEKISMLHFDDLRNTYDSISESLNDLEKHGFDVTLLRCRLNELLSIKEVQGQHLGDRKNAEREISENTKEITKFDEEMEEIEKNIARLQERHAAIKSEKDTKNLKVASLKLHVDVLNELIQNASRDFKKVATAPWKVP